MQAVGDVSQSNNTRFVAFEFPPLKQKTTIKFVLPNGDEAEIMVGSNINQYQCPGLPAEACRVSVFYEPSEYGSPIVEFVQIAADVQHVRCAPNFAPGAHDLYDDY